MRHKNRILGFSVFLFIQALFPLRAGIAFSTLPYYTRQNYSTGVGISVNVQIAVNHDVGTVDSFFITFSAGDKGTTGNRLASSWDGRTCPYWLLAGGSDSNSLKDLSDNPSASEVLTGDLGSSVSSMQLDFVYRIPAGLYPPSGEFSDTVVVTLYRGTLSSFERIASANIQFVAYVSAEMGLSVVSRGGSYDASATSAALNFGSLTPRQRLGADLLVRSNVPYSLYLSSEGGGKLTRSDAYSSEAVPYTCRVNSMPVVLAVSETTRVGNADQSIINGDRYEIEIDIGDFWNLTEGVFTDTIRITIASN